MTGLAVRTMRTPVDEGVELEVRVWDGDSDPAFLLVHGLSSNARLWDGVAEHIARAGHPVAAVDQRGHGRSDKPDAGYDFATVARDLARVLDALAWERPVVAGQSWGANVVIELALRHAGRVRGVVAVDGGTSSLAERFPEWDDCARQLAPPRLSGTPKSRIEEWMRQRHPDWPETGIQGQLACYEEHPDGTVSPWLTFDRHMAILRALWEHDPPGRLPALDVPLLLVPCRSGQPARDAAKARAVQRAAAAAPRARTHWFTADHDVHAQHPGPVGDLLVSAVEEGFF